MGDSTTAIDATSGMDVEAPDFELLVLGGGSGGFAAAITAAEGDRSVAVVKAVRLAAVSFDRD